MCIRDSSNIVQLIGTLTIMLVLEWRLTLLGLAVVPFFYLPARRIGRVLRDCLLYTSRCV